MAKKNREPGQLAQLWQVFQVTRKHNPLVTLWTLLCILGPIALAVVGSLIFSAGNIINWIIWVVLGVLVGILLGLIVMGRIAESTAYRQMQGKQGASGAVLSGALRRGWITSDQPIAVNPKTLDAVFRAIGRAGVVLVIEGPTARTQRLSDDERRKCVRLLPNVPVTVLNVGPDASSVPLTQLSKRIKKLPKVLTKAEVSVVSRRMSSLGNDMPIPKGIDPNRIRSMGRPR
nr:MAG: membrane protein [actinobacterium acMicro-1]